MDELLGSTSQSSAQTSLDLIRQDLNPQSEAEGALNRLSDDFDAFLTLLTTQLQNQDPTEPVDANEFTRQLVDFTGVEQQIATNENLERLIEAQNETQLATAVNYVGGDIVAFGNAGEVVDGIGEFTYELDAPANQVTVLITDSAGRAVYSGQGATDAGRNVVIWDGVNSFDGGNEADGTYYINVAARNASGEIIQSQTFTTGRVTGATVQDGEVMLEVAGTGVPLTEIVSVREPRTTSGTQVAEVAEEEDTSLIEDVIDGITDTVGSII